MPSKDLRVSIIGEDRTGRAFAQAAAEAEAAAGRFDRVSRAFEGINTRVREGDERITDLSERVFPAVGRAAIVAGGALAGGFGVLGVNAGLGGVVALSGAVLSLSGVLAALPAAAAVGAGAFSALALGAAGFTDALKAMSKSPEVFAKKLAELSPAARATVLQIKALGGAFDAMRKSVQERLFTGMAGEVKALSGTYLPVLSSGLGGITTEINKTAREFTGMIRQGSRVRDVTDLLSVSRVATASAGTAINSLARGFLDLAVGGSGSIGGIGRSVERVAAGFERWATNARNTGQVQQWISTGLTMLRQFGVVLGNVGGILMSVMRAGQASGGGLLGTLGQLTGRVNDFLNSAKGQTALQSVLTSAGAAAKALGPPIMALIVAVGALAPVLANIATGAGPGITAFLAALVPAFKSLVPSALELGRSLGVFLTALIPTLPAVAGFIRTAVDLFGVIAPLSPALVGLAGAFLAFRSARTAAGAIGTAVGALRSVYGAGASAVTGLQNFYSGLMSSQAAASAFSGRMGTVGGVVRQFGSNLAWAGRELGGMAASAARAAAGVAASAGRIVLAGAQMAASATATAARVVAGWVMMGVQSMLQAARMAAAWFIALGPIGWAIAAVIAVVAVIIANWDTVVNATKAAWSAVVGAVVAAWNWIGGAVGAAVNAVRGVIETVFGVIVTVVTTYVSIWRAVIETAWGVIQAVVGYAVDQVRGTISGLAAVGDWIGGFFGRARDMAGDALGGLIGIVQGIPRRILDALGDLGGMLYDAGRRLIQGLIDGIMSMISKVGDALGGVASKIRGFFPGSPVREGPLTAWNDGSPGRNLMGMLAGGVDAGAPDVARAIAAAADVSVAGPQIGSPVRISGSDAARSARDGGTVRLDDDQLDTLARKMAWALTDLQVTTVLDGRKVGQSVRRDLAWST